LSRTSTSVLTVPTVVGGTLTGDRG
jgi:hypothetical protein